MLSASTTPTSRITEASLLRRGNQRIHSTTTVSPSEAIIEVPLNRSTVVVDASGEARGQLWPSSRCGVGTSDSNPGPLPCHGLDYHTADLYHGA